MARQLKSGSMLRYKKRIFGKDWKEEYVVLFNNSALVWLKEKDKQELDGLLILKEAPELMAYGQYTIRIPNRPDLPDGYNISQLLAFGTRNRKSVHWFLCKTEEDVRSWMAAISNTLPPPPPAKTEQTEELGNEAKTNNEGDAAFTSGLLTAAILGTEWGSGWGWDDNFFCTTAVDNITGGGMNAGYDVDAFGGGGDGCDFDGWMDGCTGFIAF